MKEVRQVSGRSSESAAATARSAARQAAEDAVDRERSRIARELHDGIATDLASAISLFKTHIEGHPGFGKEGGPDEILANVFGILERMLKHTRETLAELRPRPIGPEGLLGDLRTQAEEFARMYSIRVEISSNGSEDMLPAPQREVVFQVVREALTNVRRHSGSSICRVRLAFAARPFLIEVADEGRGFTTGRSGGYGLVGMRERAAGIGGRLEVVSTEGRGTTVFLFGPN
jgi:signal transduction histidine kinase